MGNIPVLFIKEIKCSQNILNSIALRRKMQSKIFSFIFFCLSEQNISVKKLHKKEKTGCVEPVFSFYFVVYIFEIRNTLLSRVRPLCSGELPDRLPSFRRLP